MSKIQEIISAWDARLFYSDSELANVDMCHGDLLRAMDILTDQIARVADALETHNEGSLLHDTSAADA